MTEPVEEPPLARLRGELDRLDLAVYRAVAGSPTPSIDAALRRLSRASDYSKLSVAAAGALARAGGDRGRRAAAAGLVALGATSAAVNVIGKFATRRPRPDREAALVIEARHAR
ncbi:MAG TPA: hypothetical protein VK894_12675, partial [Jiangellales bacterium]|nr:hypothetical protein [Jiangellales bacterium]